MRGILSYGTYVPYFRLERSAIGEALRSGGGRGRRAVASYDEDATSMAVEAGRVALAASPVAVDAVLLATTTPAYLDKTNATAARIALGLGPEGLAADVAGSVRSGFAAVRAGLFGPSPTLVLLSDVRTGLPGSADERDGGDGAAALVLGEGDDDSVIAEYLGGASVSAEFLDRWRTPGEAHSKVWEERFGESVYLPLVEQAVTDALKTTGVAPGQVDQAVFAGVHTRAVRLAPGVSGLAKESVVDDLQAEIGNTGTAHAAMVLASVLDGAEPGTVIATVQLADGVDVAIFRVTDAIARYRRTTSVAAQLASTRDDLDYTTFLTWRGMLDREPPRRPDPERPAGPPAQRSEAWKFAFVASRCEVCGTRHLPPDRVCIHCGGVDRMTPERLADERATVATFSVDRLAYSLNPPVVVGVLDFDGGGRFQCELTDVDPAAVAIGTRVEMTFRRLYTANGVHNYFWKARPVREAN